MGFQEKAWQWYRSVGGNPAWIRHNPPADREEALASLKPLEDVQRVVVHHSGFTSGNAELLRWYHQCANGWPELGYHFIIGNGRGGHSVDGGIEAGRSLEYQGAHVRGHNHGSIGICLVDNASHFRKTPPSASQALALENLLFHLFCRYGRQLGVVRHSDLSGKTCPGPAVPVEEISRQVLERWSRMAPRPDREVTLDLRRLFRAGALDWREPAAAMPDLVEQGVTRIVLPRHWCQDPWEETAAMRPWVEMAHDQGWMALLYTGPFGTETARTLAANPDWKAWLQVGEDGEPRTYGGLPMFCPSSPYLPEHRLPIIQQALQDTGADGIFFDIPWVMDEAYHCARCREMSGRGMLGKNETLVREALVNAVTALRREHPVTWVAANVGAPGVWELKDKGATPRALSGLMDELVVELSTGRKGIGVEQVSRALANTRHDAPGCRLSHAFLVGSESPGLEDGDGPEVAGIWTSGRVDDPG